MILSLHNIAFYKKMMAEIRDSIIKKKFKELKKKYLKNHGKYKKKLNILGPKQLPKT